jgi:toxin ParE1/3/4
LTLTVVTYPEAAFELDAAIAWYEQGGTERGDRFRAQYNAAIDRVLRWPESGPRDFAHELDVEVRKVKIARSEFWVIYFVEDEILNVVAVAHERREPGYWKHRIAES